MALLLARLAVDDRDEQLGDEVVTLTPLGERQVVPEGSIGTGYLLRWVTERILVHNSLLWVEIHKK
jgi:hypothetical protein